MAVAHIGRLFALSDDVFDKGFVMLSLIGVG
jgi:hypothetical protein